MPMTMFSAGVDFTNVLRAVFTHIDFKKAKMTVELSVSLALLGSTLVNMLVKLTPAALT